ncbi:MAG: hypothetical protein ABIH00_03265 [Armatimonadota bacterium]
MNIFKKNAVIVIFLGVLFILINKYYENKGLEPDLLMIVFLTVLFFSIFWVFSRSIKLESDYRKKLLKPVRAFLQKSSIKNTFLNYVSLEGIWRGRKIHIELSPPTARGLYPDTLSITKFEMEIEFLKFSDKPFEFNSEEFDEEDKDILRFAEKVEYSDDEINKLKEVITPLFKETVEEMFNMGYEKAGFSSSGIAAYKIYKEDGSCADDFSESKLTELFATMSKIK